MLGLYTREALLRSGHIRHITNNHILCHANLLKPSRTQSTNIHVYARVHVHVIIYMLMRRSLMALKDLAGQTKVHGFRTKHWWRSLSVLLQCLESVRNPVMNSFTPDFLFHNYFRD